MKYDSNMNKGKKYIDNYLKIESEQRVLYGNDVND